jgi:hypothetical protein
MSKQEKAGLLNREDRHDMSSDMWAAKAEHKRSAVVQHRSGLDDGARLEWPLCDRHALERQPRIGPRCAFSVRRALLSVALPTAYFQSLGLPNLEDVS